MTDEPVEVPPNLEIARPAPLLIKAIETEYAGCRFRSRLEARWAVFFDALAIKWRYEPQGFVIADRQYLPDFWLPDLGRWVEVKGVLDQAAFDLLLAAASPVGGLPYGPDGEAWQSGHRRDGRILLLGDLPRISDSGWAHSRFECLGGRVYGRDFFFGRFGGEYRDIPLGDGACLTTDPGEHLLPLRDETARGMLSGGQWNILKVDPTVAEAYRTARSARFEHGESGALRTLNPAPTDRAATRSTPRVASGARLTVTLIRRKWATIKGAIKTENPALAGALRKSHVVSVHRGTVYVQVRDRSLVASLGGDDRLAQEVSKATGMTCRVICQGPSPEPIYAPD